ncbi:MerR family transcriptional regulator [Phytoactinopolyspora mesophila]|uniref:MerR family transcriptional regulator n=1 Tax=Phytoactinopolyspora mesophila TaxID=2650750 RepID=A0A7K3M9Q6_9ACTN|nr:MerR family DNA-binding transcriptional regulator [Phytoactinopolyspora mesophila]NDL59930.1 MerR family transcriptional regulator [Phytoactinopolyspora mesophila]
MGERTWTITELAAEFGVTSRTIRFYEEQGLLTPTREGTRRVFDNGDRVRLELVLRGKRLGFTLAEIKKIVGMYATGAGERGQLIYLLQQISQRRAELEARLQDISAILSEFDELERRCRADLMRLQASEV